MTASRERIVEVKRRPGGGEQRFDCALVHRTPWLVVVLYRIERVRRGVPVAPLDSYGLFWRRRPYNCYHMVRPGSGEAVLSRFDVVRDIEFDAPGEVRYVDLLLDLRVAHGRGGDVARWEDEDEVVAAVRSGLLSTADRVRIDRARAILGRRHARVTAEARRLLRSLGRLPA